MCLHCICFFPLQAVLLPAQPLPAQLPRAARGDDPPAHLHGVPKQLPVDPGPDRGRVLVLSYVVYDAKHMRKIVLYQSTR